MSKDSHFTGYPVYSQVLKLLDKEKILQISREAKRSEAYVKRFDCRFLLRDCLAFAFDGAAATLRLGRMQGNLG